jgi:hypothetical protein
LRQRLDDGTGPIAAQSPQNVCGQHIILARDEFR